MSASGAASSRRGALGIRAAPLAVGALALVVYVLTLYPGLSGGDSGELIAAVASRGVPHPPGYPLYALLGRLFVPSAMAGVAFRLNLFSALCDAAAAAVLSLAVLRRTGSPWASVTAGALFAFAPGVWAYAICAEVFALNNLMVALLLLLAVAYDERAERRYALLGAFVIGLGLSNHQTILFAAVPIAAWAAWRGRADLREQRSAALLVLLFVAGLTPYLYLPLAGAVSSPVTWGATNTWSGFLTHVLRREFGTFRLAASGLSPGSVAADTLGAWATDLVQQLSPWALPLAALGAWGCVRTPRTRPFAAVLLGAPALAVAVMMLLGNLPVSDPLHRGILARFWQEPDVFLFALSGIAVAELERRTAPWASVVIALATLAAPLLRFQAQDRKKSTLVRAYGAEILRAAPPGALIFTRGDLITNSVRYLQLAESLRPDVRVVDLELLGFTWDVARLKALHPEVVVPGGRYMPGEPGGFAIVDLLDANVTRAPILLCGGVKDGDHSADRTYGFWPFGLCDLVHPGDVAVNLDAWLSESEAALPRIDFTGQPRPPGSWEDIVWGDYWEVRQGRAAHLLGIAGADPARRHYVVQAADMLRNVVKGNPAAPPHVYKNLAVALGRAGLDSPEERASAADAWKHYLASAPKDDPALPAIEREVRRLEGR